MRESAYLAATSSYSVLGKGSPSLWIVGKSLAISEGCDFHSSPSETSAVVATVIQVILEVRYSTEVPASSQSE